MLYIMLGTCHRDASSGSQKRIALLGCFGGGGGADGGNTQTPINVTHIAHNATTTHWHTDTQALSSEELL